MTSQPKHMVITGGAGFIGSHLCDVFLEEGWRVTVVDDLSTGTRGWMGEPAPGPRWRSRRRALAVRADAGPSLEEPLAGEDEQRDHLPR